MDNNTQNTAQQRYAPPTAVVADVADGEQALAGRGMRLVAIIVDTLILLAVWWVLGKVTPLNIYTPQMAQAGFLAMLGYGLVGVVLYLIVNGWLLANRGQTVGKMLLGLRVMRRDGSAAGLLRLVGLRYGVGAVITMVPIVGMIYSLADALMIFRADRRCIHDMIADTIVVKA